MQELLVGITFNDKPVHTPQFIKRVREDNLSKAKSGEMIRRWCPQEGFQEEVCTCEADVAIIGGKRAGGKTLVMNMLPLYNIDNPLYTMYGFRREKGDLEKGLWASSQQLYPKVAQSYEDMAWKFPSGAKIQYEHIADEGKVDQRFRGVELPGIIIDELPQISVNTFFTLLASNRNTIGVKNRFVASCNPVSSKHWVHKFIQWYIDPDSKMIIPGRSGKMRYFYKYGKTVEEIAWGNTKAEVYEKARGYIDQIWDRSSGKGYESLIASFVFIEGSSAENKIFDAKDPTYLGRLAQQGGQQSVKDISGVWSENEEAKSEISSDMMESVWSGIKPADGKRCCTADVALKCDKFVLCAWIGRYLEDVLVFNGVVSTTAVDIVRNFLDKHSIREENFLYDQNGLGIYLEGHFPRAKGFNNKQAASNPKLWNNQKSECAEKFIIALRQGKYAFNPSLKGMMVGNLSFYDCLMSEKNAIQRKEVDNGRFEIIAKPDMKRIVGHSPDIIEAIFMREGINDKAGSYRNLGML